MVRPEDASHIVITASHRGRSLAAGATRSSRPASLPCSSPDAGVGLDNAGIMRLPVLDADGIIAGTTSAASAPIGDSRALYERGLLSHLTSPAMRAGGTVGMPLKEFIELLLAGTHLRD